MHLVFRTLNITLMIIQNILIHLQMKEKYKLIMHLSLSLKNKCNIYKKKSSSKNAASTLQSKSKAS